MRTHGLRATYQAGCRCDDCRQANREYARHHDRRLPANRHLPRNLPRVPIEPLIERVVSYTGIGADRLSYYDIAAACGVSHRTVVRWMKVGTIPEHMTDRIATNLGWHPAAIWGADWYISTSLKEAA